MHAYKVTQTFVHACVVDGAEWLWYGYSPFKHKCIGQGVCLHVVM